MRKPLALLVAAALTIAVGAGLSATATAEDAAVRAAAKRTVVVSDAYFQPRSIKVRKGTLVRFVWRSPEGGPETYAEHDVYSKKGTRLRSGYKVAGAYRKRIYKTTTYVCRLHVYNNMRGKITVTNP